MLAMDAARATVLLIEDDDDLREVVIIWLQRAGVSVMHASDARDALAQLQTSDPIPCVVLLDWNMPGMNGGEFLEAMRSDPRLAKIPAIVLTGDTGVRHADATVLLKPFDLEALGSIVRNHCAQRAS
jgi:CheY-like chemotaxis protein